MTLQPFPSETFLGGGGFIFIFPFFFRRAEIIKLYMSRSVLLRTHNYKTTYSKKGKWTFKCSHRVMTTLQEESWVSDSLVIGVAPQGQMRRAFLYYIERERAHPSRMNIHYNSWYDLGAGSPFNESVALDVIDAFVRLWT